MLTFMEGISDVCTTVQITDDNVLEDDESFLLTLTTSEPRVTLDPEQGSVLIIDDDSEWRVNSCHFVLNASYTRIIWGSKSLNTM